MKFEEVLPALRAGKSIVRKGHVWSLCLKTDFADTPDGVIMRSWDAPPGLKVPQCAVQCCDLMADDWEVNE